MLGKHAVLQEKAHSSWAGFGVQASVPVALGNPQVVVALDVDLELNTYLEVQPRPDGSIHDDGPSISDNIGDSARRHVYVTCQLPCGQLHRFKKVFQQNLARCNFMHTIVVK